MGYKILFIGNSYTFYHSVPELFRQIAESCGEFPEVHSVTKGGYYLDQFLNGADEYGARVKEELNGKARYDIVFLQEQSVCPAADPTRFYAAVRDLNRMVVAQGGRTVLYQTWGRKTGHPVLEEHGWTNETMTSLLAAAYQTIAAELKLELSPVGLAFYDVYTNHPSVELYSEDLTHPSMVGSYLAALCHYATIWRQSPVGIPFIPEGVTAGEADLLQRVADRVVIQRSGFAGNDG